jgi:hypothetical protein
MNLAVIHRPPDIPQEEMFIELLQESLIEKEFIIFDDMNLNLLKPDQKCKDYVKCLNLNSNGYYIANKIKPAYATRVANESSTCIDHVASNMYRPCPRKVSTADHFIM